MEGHHIEKLSIEDQGSFQSGLIRLMVCVCTLMILIGHLVSSHLVSSTRSNKGNEDGNEKETSVRVLSRACLSGTMRFRAKASAIEASKAPNG